MKGVPLIHIRGYHTDIYGHVNNARYLEFLEEGRWKFFEDFLDIETFTTGNFAVFVVNININYKRSIQLGDKIEIRSGILSSGEKSAVLRQKIFIKDSDILCAEADVTFVVIGKKEGRVLPIEGEVKQHLSLLPLYG